MHDNAAVLIQTLKVSRLQLRIRRLGTPQMSGRSGVIASDQE
jgi:hypothetical protein